MEESTSLASFFAAWEIFQHAALAGALAGALLGFLGVYVVLRRMVFLSAALSQAAGLGVTLAFYAQIYWGFSAAVGSAALGAALVTLLAVYVVMQAKGPGSNRDSLLGFTYLVGSGGALVVSTRILQELQDIETILFGSAVAVLPREFALVVAMSAAIALLHAVCLRGFILVSFDPEGARIRGLPVRLLDGLLLGSLAVAISVCTRVLGALPVFAFSVLPAMAALRLAANVRRALVLGALFGAISGFGGYLVAFCAKLPVGASQTLVAAALVVLAAMARPRTH